MNTTYNNNLLLQQQHLQQQQQNAQQGGQPQQQQQQQPSLQSDQSMNQNNMDSARLQWAQMRFGQNVADMNHAKTAQFVEMMKRSQVANQFGRHQPQQQPFAASSINLGIQHAQNSANVLGGNPQQQPFHEQHPSNMTQQPHLPPAFPNMGVMSNGNATTAASGSFQGPNPSGMLPGSQATRPLDIMSIVQSQQSQNTSVNKFPQLQQPQLALRDSQQMQFSGLSQSSPADMFPDGIRRPSPHPGNPMPQGLISHPGFSISGGNRPQNVDAQQRLHAMLNSIKNLEAQQAALVAQSAAVRGTATEAQVNQKLNDLKADIARRKDILNRSTLAWKQQSGQHHNISTGTGAQSSNNQWASNPSQGFDPNAQTRPPHMGLLPNQPAQTLQASPNLPHVSAQTNPLLNSGHIPPRTIPTPLQPQSIPPPHTNGMGPVSFAKPNPLLPKGPAGSQSNIGVQGGSAMTNFTSSMPIPMEKGQFETNFKVFLAKRGGNIDRLRGLDNRPLDLHALHVQVIQEGGFSKIEGNDNLWSIIAARLGHIQFPASASEPAKSGPGVAQTLQHIYKEFFVPFEIWSMAMVQEYKKQQANAALQASLSSTRYQLAQLMKMVNMTPSELQSLGVDEKTMQILEVHKGTLQRLLQEKFMFADGVRNNTAGHDGDQNGTMHPSLGPSPPFGHGSSQQTQQNFLSIAGRQLNLTQQQAAQHLQSTTPNVDTLGAHIPGLQMASSLAHQSFAQKGFSNQSQNVAVQLVERFKSEFAMSNFANANLEVPIEQQVEYTQFLELLHRKCADIERRIILMAIILKDIEENLLKRLTTILCVITQQRNNLSSASGPRYIVSLDQLKAMSNDLGRINEIFLQSYQTLRTQQLQQQALRSQQPSQMVNNPMVTPVGKQETPSQVGRPMMPHRPPSEVPPQQPQPPQPQSQPHVNSNQGLRPPSSVPLPAPKRRPPQTPGGSSTPSPAPVASAPTPVANTPTPTATASSPPATKSPKGRATAKSKAANAKQRRPSKVVPVPPATAEETKPTSPPLSAVGKRPREEEPTSIDGGSGIVAVDSSEAVNEGSPPKRLKTEWESQPSEAQLKRSEVVANIKTDEDAAAFFDQMAELIKRAAEEDGGQPSSITTGISETLDMLLKGYGPVPDAMDGFPVGASGESSGGREPDTTSTLGDPFDEFFDFSFGTVEDEDSKTPDLVSSSSTNPSPESNHDTESGHHFLTSASSSTIDVKTEDLSDPLRLGTWKEIDGGESAYFQATEWKYDGPMTSYDQPWAIFNS